MLGMSDEKRDVVISYETIFDMLRKEKNRSELQELPEAFIQQTCDYLQAKKTLLHKGFDATTPVEEKQKLMLHIQNMKKLLRELYDRRETKILHLAQNKVRTGNILVDDAVMLTEEKRLFEELTNLLEQSRREVLKKMTTSASDSQLFSATFSVTQEEKEVPPISSHPEPVAPEKPKLLALRFLQDVPKFVGRDLQVYGPYKVDEMASLPPELAQILLAKGRAEEVRLRA